MNIIMYILKKVANRLRLQIAAVKAPKLRRILSAKDAVCLKTVIEILNVPK